MSHQQKNLHMPRIIDARNVNDALVQGLWWLAVSGRETQSRNGPVLVAPGPVITHYRKPQERVLFNGIRDANPFFHLYEAIWMMAGRNDSAAVARYAKTMESFAEQGVLNGAYGHRWRHHFGYDQLMGVVSELGANPESRRVVLEMWDPSMYGDFYKATHGSKDVPCNTHVYFGIDGTGLNMTVCNRSNDMIWGGYGANYVHMGVLQEALAAALGVPVGSYYQMSNNFHIYPERPDTERLISKVPPEPGYSVHTYNVNICSDDRYETEGVSFMPMFQVPYALGRFLEVAERLAEEPTRTEPGDPLWVKGVFVPLMKAHRAYKDGDYDGANREMDNVASADWHAAGVEWLKRRYLARINKENGNGRQ